METNLDREALAAEVRDWITSNWDETLTVGEWWKRLGNSGWGFPTWPRAWFGKAMSDDDAAVVTEELARAGVLGPPIGAGASMVAPVLFGYATDEQRSRWLPAIVEGRDRWGQFFSEPGAGSDLAGLQTRAERDGDEWIVNGQKVWNSGTLISDWAILIARTDSDVPKHKGLTFFLIEVHQPGIEIRPIKQMNGYAEFNETFFTDARVHDSCRIGELGQGWAVALSVLSHERSTWAGGGRFSLKSVESGSRSGVLERNVREVLDDQRGDDGPLMANALPLGSVESVVALAHQHRKTGDPVIRQQIASVYALSEALRFTGLRAREEEKAGHAGGPAGSISHLGGVKMIRMYRDLLGAIAGPYATLVSDDRIAETITTAPCHGIQGGSEQIQRNVIGERLLGLPKEPQVDRETPFRLLKVGTQRD